MSERLTSILGWLTLAAILAALWVLFGEDPSLEQGARQGPLYEAMADRLDQLQQISVGNLRAQTTLVRGDTGWVIKERSDYPASHAMVARLTTGLVRSTRREPKTTRKEKFPVLGLGGAAVGIRFQDANGEPLFPSLDVGTRSEGGSGRSLTYVYKTGDSRAWLVTDMPALSAEPEAWINTDLMDLDQSLIAEVDYGSFKLVRDEAGAFTLENLAEGETAASPFKLMDPARIFAGLKAEDVQALSNPLSEPVTTLGLVTADGLRLDFTLFMLGNQSWVQVKASGTGAEAYAAKLTGWVFAIGEPEAEIMNRSRTDYLQLPDTGQPNADSIREVGPLEAGHVNH